MTRDNDTHYVAARTGLGLKVSAGDHIRITDLEGQQPVDFWAFNFEDPFEHLSPEHTKPSIGKLRPEVGDSAYTNHRRAIATLMSDSSPGQHDMQFAACDRWRYAELGAEPGHANCEDNLHQALGGLDLTLDYTPQPWNLFTNFAVQPDGRIVIEAPATSAGDHLVLRVEMEALVVVSACPQDMNTTCGGRPTPIEIAIVR